MIFKFLDLWRKLKTMLTITTFFNSKNLKLLSLSKKHEWILIQLLRKQISCKHSKRDSNSKKIAIIKTTSSLMTMINLTVKAIKTVSRISIQQSLMTETMKDTIDLSIINWIINFQIIDLITSILLSILTNDQIRILKSL